MGIVAHPVRPVPDDLPEEGASLIPILQQLDGYYQCPVDTVTGKRLGPLVGYAGRDDQGRQFVGDVYANLATLEQESELADWFAMMLAQSITESAVTFDFLVGMPMGGILLAADLSHYLDARRAFLEKKVVMLATPISREITKLGLSRHTLTNPDGSVPRIILIEDVCNNYTTSGEAAGVVEAAGGQVVAIACAFNRSPYDTWNGLPVISLVHRALPEYQQDDPAVADDVAQGDVVWKPKGDWAHLKEVMEKLG